MKELKHPIREAERYLQNARDILTEKAGKEGRYYTDKKYVKMAGDTAWKGVLVALDAVLPVRVNLRKGQRPDFQDYQEEIAKRDRKMPPVLVNAYDSLHKAMGYDGNTDYKMVQISLDKARILLNWADKQYQNQKL